MNLKVEALDEGGFLVTSPALPGLVQGWTRAEAFELAKARILKEVYLTEKLAFSADAMTPETKELETQRFEEDKD